MAPSALLPGVSIWDMVYSTNGKVQLRNPIRLAGTYNVSYIVSSTGGRGADELSHYSWEPLTLTLRCKIGFRMQLALIWRMRSWYQKLNHINRSSPLHLSISYNPLGLEDAKLPLWRLTLGFATCYFHIEIQRWHFCCPQVNSDYCVLYLGFLHGPQFGRNRCREVGT